MIWCLDENQSPPDWYSIALSDLSQGFRTGVPFDAVRAVISEQSVTLTHKYDSVTVDQLIADGTRLILIVFSLCFCFCFVITIWVLVGWWCLYCIWLQVFC